MPRVPQYQPHQANPVEPSPARLRPVEHSGGMMGGLAAGLPGLGQALANHGRQQADDELRQDDSYARSIALGLQRDIGTLARDYAGLQGQAAADAAADAKARLLALESAALEQASNPRMRTMVEELSAGPMSQALDLIGSHSAGALRQMGSDAARGERDLAVEAAVAGFADPAAYGRQRMAIIEANARLAEAEGWEEARFDKENAQTLSALHARVVRQAAGNGSINDVELAGAYFDAHADEMNAADLALAKAALKGPRDLAHARQVVDEAVTDPAAFSLPAALQQIKARTDLTAEQRLNALAQAHKRHATRQAEEAQRHEAGRASFDSWAQDSGFDPAGYVQDGEIPADIRNNLSPAAQAALDQLRDTNRARMAGEFAEATDANAIPDYLRQYMPAEDMAAFSGRAGGRMAVANVMPGVLSDYGSAEDRANADALQAMREAGPPSDMAVNARPRRQAQPQPQPTAPRAANTVVDDAPGGVRGALENLSAIAARYPRNEVLTNHDATPGGLAVAFGMGEIGKGTYEKRDANPHARGRLQRFHEGRNTPKCNAFVYDALHWAGIAPSKMPHGGVPVAEEWGDSAVSIGYYPAIRTFRVPRGGISQETIDLLREGDVISDGFHVALVTFKRGKPESVSAATPGSNPPYGGVVRNDWGFRWGQNITVRRFDRTHRP